MKIKMSILITSIVIFAFTGCGEDYEWDTDNTSALEGKYEIRDKSLDLNQTQQNLIIKSMSQKFLFSNEKSVGISVSIIYNNNSSVNVAYGCAKLKPEVEISGILNYENGHNSNCEIPLKTTHRMKIGSVTKTTVARTILDIDDNPNYDFSIDDPITKHLPDNILALGDFSGITVSHLLHHNSGLNDIDFQVGTVEEIIQKALLKGKLFDVGKMYQYNNMGYILLGQIIKYVTKSDNWEGEVLKRIKESIGENSFVFPEVDNQDWINTADNSWSVNQANTLIQGDYLLATGYSFSNGFKSNTLLPAANIANSAGDAMASVPDVTKWMRSISTNNSKLLSDNYFQHTVWEVNTDTYIDSYVLHLNWNMGAGIGFNQDQNSLFHLGLFSGYTCSSIYSKNEKTTITACINGEADIKEFPYEILKAIYPYRKAYIPTTSTTH